MRFLWAALLGVMMTSGDITSASAKETTATAVFAAGCFWCIQPPFDNAEGVIKTTVGYTGGHVENPSYDDVTSETSGHYEAIQVVYDPNIISYQQILDIFWHNIDPTDAGGQFYDRGQSYETGIFYADAAQKQAAEASRDAVEKQLGTKVATHILKADTFYPAEDYHQKYYQKNVQHYQRYKTGSGRVEKIKSLWTK